MTQPEAPTPLGLVSMTNEQYHSAPGISKSHLDKIAQAPAEYWHQYLNPEREATPPTADMLLGTVIHTAILEPDLLMWQYKVLPDLDLRTRAGRAERDAFIAAHPGATIITADQLETAKAVRDAVYRHPVVSPLFRRGRPEQTFFARDNETGELIKCRTDWLDDEAGLIVDVKSTGDASESEFARSSAVFRYYVQEPWYKRVLRCCYGEAPPYWVFVAAEKKPPYKIGLYYLTPDDIELGARVASRDLARIIACKASGQWPDYATEAKPLALPGWYRRQVEMSLA